jgi:anti-sigma regulatory factor (Ser/Thr protein kinase)
MSYGSASDPAGSISLRIRGGISAPTQARRLVLSQLEGQIEPTTAADVALIVSELVTNSVVHADVGPGRSLTVELVRLEDRVRIIVIDPGSPLEPRIRPPDPDTLGGFGLFVVDELSEAWGVARDGTAGTRVWCDVLLDRSQSSKLQAMDADTASMSSG